MSFGLHDVVCNNGDSIFAAQRQSLLSTAESFNRLPIESESSNPQRHSGRRAGTLAQPQRHFGTSPCAMNTAAKLIPPRIQRTGSNPREQCCSKSCASCMDNQCLETIEEHDEN
ncbi:MAG: hypothetical protein ABSD29_15415 [Verrucomicrobiota bacterium]|jgi:hypothetical protein